MKEIEVNDIIMGKITGVTDYGVFVQIDDNYSGLVHISEISNRYVPNIKEKFVVGDFLKARVIGVEESSNHLILSIKKLGKLDRKIIEVGSGFDKLSENFDYELWEPLEDNKIAVRFCTSWATSDEAVEKLINAIKSL